MQGPDESNTCAFVRRIAPWLKRTWGWTVPGACRRVLFLLHTQREADLQEVFVHRRFRDFFAVNEQLRSAYQGSHLLRVLPDAAAAVSQAIRGPPQQALHREEALAAAGAHGGGSGRGCLLFVFVAFWQRTCCGPAAARPHSIPSRHRPPPPPPLPPHSQDWLYKLSQIPRMRSNVDFRTFLGMVDRVRETSLLFPPGRPLELTLRGGGEAASAAAWWRWRR